MVSKTLWNTGLKRFRSEESGSVTIESVLWLPVFFAMFVMIADVSMIFHAQAQMYKVVQDANRSFAVGRYVSELETETAILAVARDWSEAATAETTLSDDGVITTIMVIPASDLDTVGIFTSIAPINVTISAQHLLEA